MFVDIFKPQMKLSTSCRLRVNAVPPLRLLSKLLQWMPSGFEQNVAEMRSSVSHMKPPMHRSVRHCSQPLGLNIQRRPWCLSFHVSLPLGLARTFWSLYLVRAQHSGRSLKSPHRRLSSLIARAGAPARWS